MIIEDLTLTQDNAEVGDFVIPISELIKIESANISVLKSFLSGTDSGEWLLEANERLLKRMMNG
jgi:hypothetical protein